MEEQSKLAERILKLLTLSSVSTARERSFAGTPRVPCCLAFLPRRRSAKVSI
jgi:hypothetical protein